MKSIKRVWILVLIMAFVMPLSLWCENVEDYAGLFYDNEYYELEQRAAELQERYGTGVYVVILPDKALVNCEDVFIEDLSELWYSSFELGLGEDSNGILLLMDMNERDYDICAHGEFANYAFTDYGKRKLSDAFADDFAENNWYAGFMCYFDQMEKEFQWAEKGDPVDVGSESEMLRNTVGIKGIVGIGFCIGLLVALVVCLWLKSKMKSVRPATSASAFVSGDGINYSEVKDIYLRTTEVVTKIESKSSGGTSTNSGGYSHSSGKF